MKKILLITLFFSCCLPMLPAQFFIQGIVKNKFQNHSIGDTIKIAGSRINPSSGNLQYLTFTRYTTNFVSNKKVILLDNYVDYWQKIWFEHRGVDTKKGTAGIKYRDELTDAALEYYAQAKGSNLVFEDDVLYDYIYQLLLKIHPKHLTQSGANNLGLIIIKSNESDYFSFDNGYIVLTTGLLASTKSEKHLVEILSSSVAHIVLEHNLVNYNAQIKRENRAKAWAVFATVASSLAIARSNYKNGTSYDIENAVDIGLSVHFLSTAIQATTGANYIHNQQVKAIQVSHDFIKQFEYEAITDADFLNKMSGAVSYTAWQEFNVMNYAYAITLINNLKTEHLATARDYLLLSKLYRLTTATDKSSHEALEFIEKGKNIDFEGLVDFDKEAGLLYLRLKNKTKAKAAFLRYKNGLLELDKQGIEVAFDLATVNHILYKNKML